MSWPSTGWSTSRRGESPTPAEPRRRVSNWDVVGSASAWEKVIGGTLNLSVALRTCQLRYCDDDEAGQHVSDGRIGILAELLALATWE